VQDIDATIYIGWVGGLGVQLYFLYWQVYRKFKSMNSIFFGIYWASVRRC